MNRMFQETLTILPDQCDRNAALSQRAVFSLFQDLAACHAEEIGVGGAAMHQRGAFWLTVHTRIEFHKKAYMMQRCEAQTWPLACEKKSYRCDRCYRLLREGQILAEGRTQWAVLGADGQLVPFGKTGFPEAFPFWEESVCTAPFRRFTDVFGEEDLVYCYKVRASDIDIGQHMNNVCYVRALLDSFDSAALAALPISALEVHFSAPCFEAETLRIYRKKTEEGYLLAAKKESGKVAVFAALSL